MTVEDLMIPRYKVIALIPFTNYEVGQVIPLEYLKSFETYGVYIFGTKRDIALEYFLQEDLDKYPHLFKRLAWYEDRELRDMPEYVRIIPTSVHPRGRVWKVKKWQDSMNTFYAEDDKHSSGHFIGSVAMDNHYFPATLTEYEAYLNQNK